MKAHHKRAFNFRTVIRFAVALFVAWSVYCPAAFAETLIIDDGGSGTSSTGSWSVSGGSNPYGDGSLWSKTTNGTYSFESVLSGYYEVSLWWTEWPSRCTNVPVKIYDGTTLIDTVYVNQQQNTGQWNLLGPYNFQNDSGRVTITSVDGSCSTCADAVRFVSTAAPELDSISIEGPSEVQENSTEDYRCRAHYSDGSSQIVDADSWSDNCTCGDIGPNGQLTTSEVESDEQCRITSAYTEGSTENAVLDITITNFVPSSEVIIDDGGSGTSSTGSWSVSGGSNPYGDGSLWSKTTNGTYSFESVLSGYYKVSLWWTGWSSRCTNVPVKIYDGATLIDTVYVNQQDNGSQWNLLGSYNFQNGSGRVTITSVDGSCSTCADAVQFVSTAAPELDSISIEGPSEVQENSTEDYRCRAHYSDGSSQIVDADSWSDNCTCGDIGPNGQLTTSEVESDEQCRITSAYTEGSTENAVLDITITNFVPSSEVIIDDGDSGTSSTGSWSVSGGSNPYGISSLWSKTTNGTYSFESVLSGYYEVSLWWTEWPSRCTNVPVKIYDGTTLIDTVYVNQQQNTGQWNLLGPYNFQNGSGRVTITSVDGSCSTCADAVQFVSTAAPELDSISIEGPSEVQENSTEDYRCRAHYSDGSSQIVDADSWSDNCTCGDIGPNGQLTTSEVESDEQCRITSAYTEGSTENAVLDITITNFVPSSEVIIDDGDSGTSSTGSWSVSGGSNPYGISSLWSKTTNGTYSFESVLSGYYEVSLWWTEWPSRCTNVPVKIYDGTTLIDTVYVNQQQNTGQWNLLGPYNFQNGSGRVTITSVDGSCSTCADAVRFVSTEAPELNSISIEGPSEVQENSTEDYRCRAYYSDGSSQIVDADSWSDNCTCGDIGPNGQLTTSEVESDEQCRITSAYTEGSTENAVLDITITNFVPSSEVIIDNGGSGTSSTGSWKVSGAPDPYGDDSLYSKEAGAIYTFVVGVEGCYEVSLWWTEWSSRCTSVPVEIYDGDNLLDTVHVNQKEDGGQWNLLGAFTFFSGTARVRIISGYTDFSTCADAVKLVYLSEAKGSIIDNNDLGFTSSGGWEASRTWPVWYGSNYLYAGAGESYKLANWYFEIVADGTYNIGAWWSSTITRAKITPYTIYNNGVNFGTVCVDQRLNGGQFNLLGTLTLEAGDLVDVSLTGAESGSVSADAIQIVNVGEVDNYAPNGVIDLPHGDITITEGGYLNFEGTGHDPDGNGPLSYFWNFGTDSGIPSSISEDPGYVKFINPGTFTVTFTVTDSMGIVDPIPATKTIHVAELKEPIVIDNLDTTSFSTIGSWPHSTTYVQWYGNDYQYAVAGTGSKSATWHFEVTQGVYEVSAWWSSAGTRAPDAPYTIHNNGIELETVYVDQTTDGSQFNVLGVYTLDEGNMEIVLADDASGSVIADAVRLIKRCKNTPCVSIIQPLKSSFRSSDTIYVLAESYGTNSSQTDLGVKFILDDVSEFIDNDSPFEATFENVGCGEHSINVFLIDSEGPISGNSTHDMVSNVAVGDYYVAVGDSITYGTGDDDFSDDSSVDGRTTGGGYPPILADLLTMFKECPQFIANEGVGGYKSSNGVYLVGVLLPKYPEAQRFLIQYGTNDVGGFLPIPSGIGLHEGDEGYPGSYKDNMKQIIDLIRNAGKEACLAKPPILRGDKVFSEPYDNPEEAQNNQLIREYIDVIDELQIENEISVEGPDFYMYFKDHLWDEYFDNLHPNGIGYRSMADLWFDALK